MTGHIKYKVLKDIGLTLIYYEGLINLKIVKDHLITMGNDPDYDPGHDAITDFGNCEFEINTDDITNVANFLRNAQELLGERKQAFIFRTPKQQAISSLFSMISGDLPVIFDVVSDLRDAKIFVGVQPEHYPVVLSEFNKMKG